MLAEFLIDERWLTSGLLDEELLRAMYANSLKDEYWQEHRLSSDYADHGAGTKHWRTGLLGEAVRSPVLHENNGKFEELLLLLAIDPDPGMAGNVYYSILCRDELGFSSDQRMKAAMSSASRTQPDATLGFLMTNSPHSIEDWCALHFAGASTWNQQTLKAARSLKLRVVLELAFKYGNNARVRKYGRHGLCLLKAEASEADAGRKS